MQHWYDLGQFHQQGARTPECVLRNGEFDGAADGAAADSAAADGAAADGAAGADGGASVRRSRSSGSAGPAAPAVLTEEQAAAAAEAAAADFRARGLALLRREQQEAVADGAGPKERGQAAVGSADGAVADGARPSKRWRVALRPLDAGVSAAAWVLWDFRPEYAGVPARCCARRLGSEDELEGEIADEWFPSRTVAMKAKKAGSRENWRDVEKTIAAATQLNTKDVKAVFAALRTIAYAEVKKTQKFVIPKLLTLELKHKPARKAGTKVMFGREVKVAAKPASKVVRVFPAKALKDRI